MEKFIGIAAVQTYLEHNIPSYVFPKLHLLTICLNFNFTFYHAFHK